jgi:hypothetical protein
MTIVLILAIIIGILQARQKISSVRNRIIPGVTSSKSLIAFTFLNK